MKQIWFNKKLYVDGLRRLRMTGLTLLAITIILTLFLIWTSNLPGTVFGYANLTPIVSAYMYAAPVLLVFTAFSFLFRRSASDLYHAFPITRTGLYITLSASVFTWAIGTILVTRLLAYICILLQGQAFALAYFVLQTLSYCVGALLIGACTLIGVSITGTRFSAFIVSGLVLFLPRCISALCGYVLTDTAPLLVPTSLGLLFDVTLNIPVMWFLDGFLGMGNYLVGSNFIAKNMLVSYQAQIYTLVLALMYLALGAVAFLKRASETAEKSAPSGRLQHVYRSLISMPLFLLLAIMTARSNDQPYSSGYTILMIFAVLVYFLYELITTKRFKNLLYALYVLPIPVLVCFGIAFGSVLFGKSQMRVLPSASELTGLQLATSLRGSVPSYAELLQSEITFTEPELLQLASGGLTYSYESYNGKRSGSYDRTLILQRKSGGDLVRNISMPSANEIRFDEVTEANASFRAAALALPRDEEIYRIDASAYTYAGKSEDAAALKNLLKLYRADRSKLSYEDLPPSSKAVAIAVPVTKEDTKLTLYKGDAMLDFSLRAEGMHRGKLFSDTYFLTQKTPDTANAAMRFCNGHEQEMKREILATLDSGVSIDWISIGLQLCNIPTDDGALNSEYVNLRSMKDFEENAATYEKDLTVLHMEQIRTLLGTLFSGDYTQPDIQKPFAQFNINVEYTAKDGNYTSQAMSTVYVMLDEKSMQTVLAIFPWQYTYERALQDAVS